MRRGMVAAVAVLIMLIGPAQAQSTIPDGVFVRESNGTTWLVLKGQRVGVPVWQAGDTDIAAIPVSDQWAVLSTTDTGAMVGGSKPAWLAAQEAAQAAPVAAPAPPAAPVAEQPTTLSGTTSQNTRAFQLAGGSYTAKWTAKLQARQSSCYVGARLNRADDQSMVESVMSTTLNQQTAASASGETQLYGVKAGRYYLDATTTGCDWGVTFIPSP